MAKKNKKSKKAAEESQLDSFSAAPESLDFGGNDSQVGQTSEEIGQSSRKLDENKLAFGLWDLTALISFVCITLATMLLFFELQRFGNLLQGTWPWSVSTVEISAPSAAAPSVD